MPRLSESEVADVNVKFSCTVGYFDTFIQSIESFRDEGKLLITDNKIFTEVADPANVGLCISKIEGEALNGLSLEGTDEIKIGLNFNRVRDCLSGASSTSDLKVTWPVTSGGANMMRLDIVDDNSYFEITTLDPDVVQDIQNMDALSHKNQIVVDGSELKKAISNANRMIDQDDNGVLFEVKDEMLKMVSKDKTAGNFYKQFHNNDPSVDDTFEEHQTLISIQYLEDIKSVFSQAESVTIHIKDDNPIRFDVDLDTNGNAQIIYIIAPRLEKD
jgi:DNA polymerase III sliding clamp (beta) subunit (PCNA family)